jgi:NADH:ubiquinone oxidoreductase subunit K
MQPVADPIQVQILAAVLFSIGVAVVLTRRNVFLLLMGVELLLNAVNLSFTGFGREFSGAPSLTGQMASLFIIAIAAAEACVGLAMVICLARGRDSIDSDAYSDMKE